MRKAIAWTVIAVFLAALIGVIVYGLIQSGEVRLFVLVLLGAVLAAVVLTWAAAEVLR